MLTLILLAACVGGKTDVEDTQPIAVVCGEQTCDGRTEYCYSVTGGVPDTDGEANVSHSCVDLPASCLEDRTCTCLLATSGGGADCVEDAGGLYLSIAAP